MMFLLTAPKPKVGEPVPSNVPMSWLPAIGAAASVLAFAVLPAVHTYVPQIPAFDLSTVQGALGVTIGVGLWIHQVGSHAAFNYFVANILPGIETTMGPQIEAEIAAIVQAELDKHDVKVASIARLKAIQDGPQKS